MAYTDTAMTALGASFTLPTGVNGKLYRFSMAEGRRRKDSEGFVDAGFQTGKLTGQGLSCRVVGYIVSTGGPGIGAASTVLENISVTATLDTGRAITFNATFTDIEWGAACGEMQAFSASILSNGNYTNGTL